MEFKKPNKQQDTKQSQPTPSAPTAPADHSTPKPRSKKALIGHARQFLVTKKGVLFSIGIVAIIGSLSADAMVRHYNDSKKTNTTNANGLVENIEYQTVLPSGKSITALGGWKRISPPASNPVYAYTDSIDGIAISVSEQPLPDAAKGSSDQEVAKIAKKFNASNTLDAGETTAYYGTSAKGPQSVIFSKNGLLILIKSQKKIDDKAWIGYINSLS